MEQKYLISHRTVSYLDNYFFEKPKLIVEADAATFEQIGDWFARDAKRVYFLHNIVEGADPTTFVVLGGYNNYWAKDHARAYWFWPSAAARNIRRLQTKSIDRFAILKGCRFKEYACDRERVYRCGKLIRGADAATFHVMKNACKGEDEAAPSFSFARDNSRVYYEGKPLADVNLTAFAAIRLPGIGHNEFGVDGMSGLFKSNRTGKMVRIPFLELPEAVRAAYVDRGPN